MVLLVLCVSIVCVMGMWKVVSSVLFFILVSVWWCLVSIFLMSRCVVLMLGWVRLDSGGGVCCSSCWLV